MLSMCLNMYSENFANEYCFCSNNKKGPNFHEFPCFQSLICLPLVSANIPSLRDVQPEPATIRPRLSPGKGDSPASSRVVLS